MFKYKKLTLTLCTFMFILLSFIELVKYLFVDSNVFGMIYLISNLLIIFLLLPTSYNYKKYFSKARISKLIIIILLGIFNSFILQSIYLNNIGFVDDSKRYIESIFFIKSILKPIIYFLLLVITIFEFRVEKLFQSIREK